MTSGHQQSPLPDIPLLDQTEVPRVSEQVDHQPSPWPTGTRPYRHWRSRPLTLCARPSSRPQRRDIPHHPRTVGHHAIEQAFRLLHRYHAPPHRRHCPEAHHERHQRAHHYDQWLCYRSIHHRPGSFPSVQPMLARCADHPHALPHGDRLGLWSSRRTLQWHSSRARLRRQRGSRRERPVEPRTTLPAPC